MEKPPKKLKNGDIVFVRSNDELGPKLTERLVSTISEDGMIHLRPVEGLESTYHVSQVLPNLPQIRNIGAKLKYARSMSEAAHRTYLIALNGVWKAAEAIPAGRFAWAAFEEGHEEVMPEDEQFAEILSPDEVG